MARTKHTSLQRTCPICREPPGLATILCIKCNTLFHNTCVNWNSPPPFMCLDCGNSDEYLVKGIIDHRSQNNKRQFQVEWYRGEPTWEPETNLGNCLALLKDYIASNSLEPTTMVEPAIGHVGSSSARTTNNWVTILKIKWMIEKWSAKIPSASLDLPITVINKDKLDSLRDQLLLLKQDNHCFVGLLVVSTSTNCSSTKCTIYLGDGNNTYYSESNTRIKVNKAISPLLGWVDLEFIPTKANFGARSDLCGAAGIMIGLGLSMLYKARRLTDEIFFPFKYRNRILAELRSSLDTHYSRPFIPSCGPKCTSCGRRFLRTCYLRNHQKFCVRT